MSRKGFLFVAIVCCRADVIAASPAAAALSAAAIADLTAALSSTTTTLSSTSSLAHNCHPSPPLRLRPAM